MTEAVSCPPISFLLLFIIELLSFSWSYGCPFRGHISQPSLKLTVVLRLGSGQWEVNRSEASTSRSYSVLLLFLLPSGRAQS